jgi:hypothetical protein
MRDLCKPNDGGPADVRVGTGQLAYAPLTAGEVLQAETGPQGGHHLWVAIQTRNLDQRSTTTTISAVQPGTGTAISPSSFAYPFDLAEDSTCELYGLRYQLDNEGIDYLQFLGKPLDLRVAVRDRAGASAISSVRVQVAPTVR